MTRSAKPTARTWPHTARYAGGPANQAADFVAGLV